jgi:hypothetical protein
MPMFRLARPLGALAALVLLAQCGGDKKTKIFARWLQKKVVITDSANVQHLPHGGYGPDRQQFQIPQSGAITGTLSVYAEDGVTPLASGPVNVSADKAYQLVLDIK